MSAPRDSTDTHGPKERSIEPLAKNTQTLLVFKPIPSAQRAGRRCHEDKAARARKHAWMLGSCMQVQNIIEISRLHRQSMTAESHEEKSAELQHA